MSLENPGILNWRRWSAVRKVPIVGALIGALITLGMQLVLRAYDGGPFAFLLLWSCGLTLWPAAEISKIFGWSWQIDISQGPSWIQLSLATLANALLLFLVGTLIEWIAKKAQTSSNNNSSL